MSIARKLLIAVFVVLLLVIPLSGWLVRLLTEWWWFDNLKFGQVFTRIVSAQFWLFLMTAVLAFVVLWPQCVIARRYSRDLPVPILTRLIPLDDKLLLDRYVDKYLVLGVAVFCALWGFVTISKWHLLLRFFNAVPFGATDPIFGKEISFYVFRMPFWELLWKTVFSASLFGLIAAALLYIYDDIIQLASERAYIAPKALGHLSACGALVFLMRGIGYEFSAWKLLYSTRGVTHGVGYVDAHVYLPAYRILMVAAMIVAGLLLWNYRKQSFKLALGAVGAHVALSVLLLSVAPGVVQKLIVTPNELGMETPYIEHNIKLTREAYGLSNIATVPHPAQAKATTADLARNELTLNNIRIWDDRPLLQTYAQLQGIRPYYAFADVDIDRYRINGRYRQVMLAARELSYERIPRRTWVNDHLKYTHGYGVCMNPVNYAGEEGQPDFYIQDIPPISSIDIELKQPAFYYGEDPDTAAVRREREEEDRERRRREGGDAGSPTPQNPSPEMVGEEPRDSSEEEEEGGPDSPSPLPPFGKLLRMPKPRGGVEPEQAMKTALDYVIVNSSTEEFDYPKGNKNVNCRYSGEGGVPVNSLLRRIAFGFRFSSVKIPLSGYVREGTRILFHRRILDRCRSLARFLRYDRDPYIVIADGKLYWIVDAYTTTDMYPYAERTRGLGNYVRNPVKVVIDAYNGDVTFYVVDPHDPILKSYARIFPDLFTPFEEMPQSLQEHLRYPTGMFMIQAMLYAKYHMADAEVFYNQEDLWQFPKEIFGEDIQPQMEAYYMVTKPPGETEESFYLFLPFTPAGKDNVIAWMCANCDIPNYGDLTIYTFPKDKVVYGPMQIEARIDQDEHISKDFTLWSQKGSQVIRGNVLVIPVEDSLLYVEPVYLQAERSELPELKRIIVVNGNDIAMERTLEEALETLFPGLGVARGVAVAGARVPPGGEVAPPKPSQTVEPVPPPQPTGAGDPRQPLIDRAGKLFEQATKAREQGDFATYGEKINELGRVIEKLRKTPAGGSQPLK